MLFFSFLLRSEMKEKRDEEVRAWPARQAGQAGVSGVLLVPGPLAQAERGEAHAADEEPGTGPGRVATGLVPGPQRRAPRRGPEDTTAPRQRDATPATHAGSTR